MYIEHRIFEAPSNQNQKIWRYMDFTKFIDLLNSSSLFFCRSDSFEDSFEGSLSKPTVEARNVALEKIVNKNNRFDNRFWQKRGEDEKKNIAINCWHMNDYESAAMWKLYLKSNEGIAIQSTYSKLLSSLNDNEFSIFVGKVNYIDYNKDFFPFGNGFAGYVHKRKSFEHEKELRCLLWKTLDTHKDKLDLDSGGAKIKINLNELIENIYISPNSPLWLTNLVKEVINRYDYNFEVINSGLDDKPLY